MNDEWQSRVREFCAEQGIGHTETVIRILGIPAFVAVKEMYLGGVADRLITAELLRVAREAKLM